MKNLKKRFNPLFILLFFYVNLGNAQTSYFEISTPEEHGISSSSVLKFIIFIVASTKCSLFDYENISM